MKKNDSTSLYFVKKDYFCSPLFENQSPMRVKNIEK